PSQPITGFLRSEEATKLLRDRPVLTVIGCRNMWLNGQEEVKQDLRAAGASLVGNIVLQDDHPNIISTLTVIRWAFTGQKQAAGILPAAGVADHDIRRSSRFGTVIYRHLTENKLQDLQHDLLMSGAINLDPG